VTTWFRLGFVIVRWLSSWCLSSVVLVALAACSSAPPDAIGEACDTGKGCGGGLFCYAGTTTALDGLCTVTCMTTAGTTDPCTARDPNSFCFGGDEEALVCARWCGSNPATGEPYPPCPSGSSCNANDGACERQ
jgi:hypothetical protein